MNIFIIAFSFEEYTSQLANGLGQKDNVAIAFLDTRGQKFLSQFSQYIATCSFKKIIARRFPFPNPRSLFVGWWLFQEVQKHKTDVIHIQAGSNYVESLVCLMLAKLKGIPIVTTIHDTTIHSGDVIPLRRRVQGGLLRCLSDLFIVHGHILARELEDQGMNTQEINVVPHGNYDIYYHADGAGKVEKTEEGRILLFGRMIRYKGLEVLIRAAPLIASEVPALKIVIAGRGPELDRLLPSIIDNPLFEIHNRFIETQEVKTFFTRARLIVLPYLDATQSGPLSLAFSFGRPVVASQVGAMPEVLSDGVEGLLIPSNDPEALAEAIVNILKNGDIANLMGRAGRRKALTELNWTDAIAEQTRKVYQKAIDRH